TLLHTLPPPPRPPLFPYTTLFRSMNRLEQRIGKIDEVLTKDEQRTAFKEVFDWLGTTTEIPPNSYTREWARELLAAIGALAQYRSEEHTSELQSRVDLVCRLLLEK